MGFTDNLHVVKSWASYHTGHSLVKSCVLGHQYAQDRRHKLFMQIITFRGIAVLGKADPGTFFQCKNIEEGNAIIEDGKRQVFFLNIKKDNRFFLFPFFLNIKTTAVSLQQRKKRLVAVLAIPQYKIVSTYSPNFQRSYKKITVHI